MYLVLSHYQVLAYLSTDKTIAPHRHCHRMPITAWYKQSVQVLLPTLSSWKFKPPSSIMEDKISITPFVKKGFIMPTLWHICESFAKLLKNVIGGAIIQENFLCFKTYCSGFSRFRFIHFRFSSRRLSRSSSDCGHKDNIDRH